jgi:FAD:protein FMN transferase
MSAPCELLIDGTAEHVALATAEVRRLESIWTRFDPASELVALNQSNGEWFAASEELFEAVQRCEIAYRITNGAFDPTIITALEQLGYDRTFLDVASDGVPGVRPESAPGFHGVEIDPNGRRVRVPAGVRIDLGGIGKGLAADRVAGLAVAAGARAACVSLGGDVHVAGEPSEPGGWPIPILHPLHRSNEFATVRLQSGGVVTSTSLERSWRRGDITFHHIVDPRTGDSSRTDVAAAIVAHASTAAAEVLAKASMVLGSAGGRELVAANDAWGWFLLTDGQMVDVAHPLDPTPANPDHKVTP